MNLFRQQQYKDIKKFDCSLRITEPVVGQIEKYANIKTGEDNSRLLYDTIIQPNIQVIGDDGNLHLFENTYDDLMNSGNNVLIEIKEILDIIKSFYIDEEVKKSTTESLEDNADNLVANSGVRFRLDIYEVKKFIRTASVNQIRTMMPISEFIEHKEVLALRPPGWEADWRAYLQMSAASFSEIKKRPEELFPSLRPLITEFGIDTLHEPHKVPAGNLSFLFHK